MDHTVGRYILVERIDVGPHGTVWRGRDPDLDRDVAIKHLPPDLAEMPERLALARGEAHVLASLSDPHVVRVHDFVENADGAWIVEDWVPGQTLRERLAASGRLTAEQAVGTVRGLLLGLAHVHDAGLVHGDISSSNVLVDESGEARLVDFGQAAAAGTAGARGTPVYMSPEAVRGDPLTPVSDLYSCAALLYELLDGSPPFADGDVDAVLAAQLEQVPLPVAGAGAVGSVVLLGLAKDPTRRPQDARTFLALLEQAAQERFGVAWLGRASLSASGVAGGIVGSGKGVARVSRWSRGRLVAFGGVVTVLVAVGVTIAVASSSSEQPPAAGAGLPSVSPAQPGASPTSSAEPAPTATTTSDLTCTPPSGTTTLIVVLGQPRGPAGVPVAYCGVNCPHAAATDGTFNITTTVVSGGGGDTTAPMESTTFTSRDDGSFNGTFVLPADSAPGLHGFNVKCNDGETEGWPRQRETSYYTVE